MQFGPGKGGILFYLDPIFMKISPAGPNFTSKTGPGKGEICLTKIQFLRKLAPQAQISQQKLDPG